MSETIPHRASPQKVIWRITDRCDLDCAHCGSHGPLEAPEVLALDELLAIAEDIAAAGCETVVISGGEPLVHQRWQAVAEALLQHGVGVTLVTNGTRFNAAVASWCRDAGIAAVHFSLDGTEASHDRQRREQGSFASVMEAIQLARVHGLRVAVVTTITRMVLDDLEALHALLQRAGVGHWQLRLAARHAGNSLTQADYLGPEEVPALVERLRAIAEDPQPPRLFAAPSIGYYGEVETDLRGAYSTRAWSGCTCGLSWCTIGPGGEVKACGSSTTIEGNVRETPLGDIWSSPGAFQAARRFSLDSLVGSCRSCDWARLCRGGCLAIAEQREGRRETRHCLQHPATGGPRDQPDFWERRRARKLRKKLAATDYWQPKTIAGSRHISMTASSTSSSA